MHNYRDSIWRDYKTPVVEPNFIKATALRKGSQIQTFSYAFVESRKLWILDKPNKLSPQWKYNINYAITYASIKLPEVLSTYVCFYNEFLNQLKQYI